jgi:hypothetical protein
MCLFTSTLRASVHNESSHISPRCLKITYTYSIYRAAHPPVKRVTGAEPPSPSLNPLKADAVKSVLRISSAHNKEGPADIKYYKHCPNFASFELFWVETSSLYSFTSIAISEPEKCEIFS